MPTVLDYCSPSDQSDDCLNTIASRFEHQAAAHADELAIVADDISLTYRALDLKASRIAGTLIAPPSQKDRPVVLFMKDEAARIAAMLGAAKANRIFIPLAPVSPARWVSQILEESDAVQVIVDSSTYLVADKAASGGVAIMEVEELDRLSESFASDRPARSDDTAFIVYTSGSTGRPKGVANSQRGFIRNCDIRIQAAEVGCNERYANLRSSGQYSWIRNSLSPLLSGGCLFPFDLHRRGLQNLAPWIISEKITYISFSSSLLRTWLASIPDEIRFPTLRFVGATGERLYAQDVNRLSRHLVGNWRIGYSYSSTETGTVATQVFTPSCPPDVGIVPVGTPLDDVEVDITNEVGKPVSQGETGEIVIRSRFLAQGYWKSPELTAKAFETDPRNGEVRLYRTGDLGRWQNNGMLEYVGRKGRKIRLRGYNIEPFEVECELMRQPGVSDAVVILHDSVAGKDPSLVAYVAAPSKVSSSILREALAKRLPPYMIPSRIIILDVFPIASSGKMDRDALPPPHPDEMRSAHRSPSNDCEHKLLRIWQDVLKISKIGIDDDFFELGGTSLQALMIFARIETRLRCSLSPTTIVQTPTIALLAEYIRTAKSHPASQTLMPLRTSGAGLPLFLVHGRHSYVMHYRYLIKDLKSDRPVFGLQPLPLDGQHQISRTIESMAANYVTEIRQVQPQGPYFLAGHSFGGRVSFEIAQQLARAGERVSFLGLIDTSFHDNLVVPRESELRRLGRKTRSVLGLRDLLFRGLRYISRAILIWPQDLWIRLGHSIPHKYRPTYYEWLCRRANRNYVCRPYSGHITIFSCGSNSERQRAHWGPLAHGGVTVLEVPAGHDDMILPPHSAILARYFDACIDAVR